MTAPAPDPATVRPDLTRPVDLTQEFHDGMPVYPGLVPTRIRPHQTHAQTRLPDGTSYASYGVTFSDHAGTHVDAPNHIDPAAGAAGIDALPLTAFCGAGICLDLAADTGPVTRPRLAAALAVSGLPLLPGDVLLLRTGVQDRLGGTDAYLTDYRGLDEDACRWVAGHRVKALGVDQPSPDDPDDSVSPAHTTFVAAGILIYENLANLGSVAGRRFWFAGFPVPLRGATGAPVRAVAFPPAGT
ncbi:cyclase family protein [Streptomyces sp. NPDC001980]|uniref:cyclase family protein n=1 Tax=Streptomyces sp. NPDC001980 TaxID=3157126 RepID=UPI0033247697